MAATSQTLGQLHALFAQYWMDMMGRTDEDGKSIPLSASEAAVLRAFLKDNNVQADPDETKELGALAAELRAATKGSVSDGELDHILQDFASFSGSSVQ